MVLNIVVLMWPVVAVIVYVLPDCLLWILIELKFRFSAALTKPLEEIPEFHLQKYSKNA